MTITMYNRLYQLTQERDTMITTDTLDTIKTIINVCKGLTIQEIEAVRSALYDVCYKRKQAAEKQVNQALGL